MAVSAARIARRRIGNAIFMGGCVLVTVVALAALAAILWSLASQGLGGLNLAVFTKSTPAPGSPGGLSNAIVGSMMLGLEAMAIAVVVGILAGTWLAEYAGDSRYGSLVRFLNDVLLSAPSILVGLFVYELLVAPVGGFSGLAGGVALALIAAPVITRTTEDTLRLQATSLRESGVAVGAPLWRVIASVLWRSGAPGIITGALLAFARISGETAPLLFTALNNQFFSLDMTKPMANLPVVIFQFALSAYDDWRRLAWAGRADHRRFGAGHHYPRPDPRGGAEAPMNSAAPDSFDTSIAAIEAGKVKLSIEGLDFHYGKTRALKNVSMQVPANAVTALIGPSGCGKSTLLRALNRMYALYPGQTASGRIMLDGEDILRPGVDLSMLRARVGMVFQKPTPFPMSIFDNVAFGVRLYEPLSKAQMAERVEDSLRRAALWDEVKDKLSASGLGLSGGQQQRLCVARCIAVRPEILLLDEPTSALDPISSARLEETVTQLKADYTIVIVTHNLGQAARLSNYTGFMYLGELVEFGPTEAMFTKPNTGRASDYITGRFG